MSKNEWLIEKLQNLDDEGFVEVIGEISERSAVTQRKPKDGIVHILESADAIEERSKTWGQMKGISTGYTVLDEKIKGLQKGHVILIGGETSQGKSAFAANIARNVAKEGRNVLFITLEMLREELEDRFRFINGGHTHDLNISFQLERGLDYYDLRPIFEKNAETWDTELIVVDYLQYLGRGMTNSEVAKMSKEIKSLALDFQIPLVVIVSLRKSESGKIKRKWTDIEIEEFMGTSAIGYDCDVAMITSKKDPEGEWQDDKFYVKLLKTRNSRLDYNDRIMEFNWHETKITEEWVTPVKKELDS
jgi:replicative DNA helicase